MSQPREAFPSLSVFDVTFSRSCRPLYKRVYGMCACVCMCECVYVCESACTLSLLHQLFLSVFTR